MKLFPRWHTPEEVAARLIAGLESGELYLRYTDLSVPDAIAEGLRLGAEVNAGIVRLDPTYVPPALPSASTLEEIELRNPGSVHELLGNWQQMHTDLKKLEDSASRLARLVAIGRLLRLAAGIAIAAFFVTLYLRLPLADFIICGLFFLAGLCTGGRATVAAMARKANVKVIVGLEEIRRFAVAAAQPSLAPNPL